MRKGDLRKPGSAEECNETYVEDKGSRGEVTGKNVLGRHGEKDGDRGFREMGGEKLLLR